MFHRSWAEINLGALKHNLNLVRRKVGESVPILFPVKADAYGHGLEKISLAAVEHGVSWLGVANIQEAIRVRSVLPEIPLLILGLSFPEEVDEVVSQNVSSVVSSLDWVRQLNQAAEKQKRKAKIHLKVDTGMGRIGIWHEETFQFLDKILNFSHIELEGILTHFPSAEDPNDSSTKLQIQHLKSILQECQQRQISFKYVHLANSSGVIHFPESYESMVRPGLMLYGISPNGVQMDLKPILQLKSRLLFVKEVEAGRSISYGRTFVTPKRTKIGTIPIGYADGYPRSLSNQGQVLIHGKRCPVVGRVTMDQIMVDLGLESSAQVGDEVTLIGQSGNEAIRVEQIAQWANTISYEVLTNLGDRIYRVYT